MGCESLKIERIATRREQGSGQAAFSRTLYVGLLPPRGKDTLWEESLKRSAGGKDHSRCVCVCIPTWSMQHAVGEECFRRTKTDFVLDYRRTVDEDSRVDRPVGIGVVSHRNFIFVPPGVPCHVGDALVC